MDVPFPPCAAISNGRVAKSFLAPVAFTGPDGLQHAETAWSLYSADDWGRLFPDWTFVPLVDGLTSDASKRAERLSEPEWTVTDDAVTVTYRRTEKEAEEMVADLAAAQADAVARANREAGETRARYITVTVGQEGTYLEKAREAQAFLADADPDPATYPYLAAEAEATAQPIADIAALVAATAAAWTPVNARIEGLRQGALQAVKNAGTPAAVAGVFPINWPVPG